MQAFVVRHQNSAAGATLAVLGLLTFAGCEQASFGNGIGRPPVAPTLRDPGLALNIDEVYLGGTGARYAKVSAQSTPCAQDVDCGAAGSCGIDGTCTQVDLTGVSFCLGAACIVDGFASACQSCQPLDGIVTTGQTVSLTPATNVPAGVGDAALVDAEGAMHAYVAWGAEPGSWGSPLVTAAFFAGRHKLGDFVDVGFPVADGVAIVNRSLQSRGCGVPAAGATTPAELSNGLCTRTDVLDLGAVDTSGGTSVELVSTAAQEVSLFGVQLCHSSACVSFAPDQTLAAGATLKAWLVDDARAMPADVVFASAPLAESGTVTLLGPGSGDPNAAGLRLDQIDY